MWSDAIESGVPPGWVAVISAIAGLLGAFSKDFWVWIRGKPKEDRASGTQLIKHYDGLLDQLRELGDAREAKLQARIDRLEAAVESSHHHETECLKLSSSQQMEITMLKASRDSLRERVERLEAAR